MDSPDSTWSLDDQTHSQPMPSIERSFATLRYFHSFTLPFSYELMRDKARWELDVPSGAPVAGRRCTDMMIPGKKVV